MASGSRRARSVGIESDAAARRRRAQERGLTPRPTTEGRSRNLRAIKRTNTAPEIRLRSLLHANGLRFRKDYRFVLADGVKVRPDVVFTRARVAVFYDSCFWHSCPKHGRSPRVNDWYWEPKLARTVERDQLTTDALIRHGWLVIRIWEHDDLPAAAHRVADVVRKRRE
jgi:DNA mismatch endonuclease, patch repair protein